MQRRLIVASVSSLDRHHPGGKEPDQGPESGGDQERAPGLRHPGQRESARVWGRGCGYRDRP